MGIRPPSLYVYFDGKNALYDALFERGWRELLAVLHAARDLHGSQPPDVAFATVSEIFVRWAVEHPAYAPLMFWRPVPGFTPSQPAYGPAIEVRGMALNFLSDMQRVGALRGDVDLEQAYRTWTTATSGVMTQQLANAPGEPFATGTFTSTLPAWWPCGWPTTAGSGSACPLEYRKDAPMSAVTTARPPTRAAVLDRETAMHLAATEYGRFADLLRTIGPDDWAVRPTAPTGTCARWRVTRSGWRRWWPRSRPSSPRTRGPRGRGRHRRADVAAGAEDGAAVPGRAGREVPVRRPTGGPGTSPPGPGARAAAAPEAQVVGGHRERWTFGFLFDVVLTRDTWMHRADISRAIGRPMELTPEHDGVLVADVVAEWAERHGRPTACGSPVPRGASGSPATKARPSTSTRWTSAACCPDGERRRDAGPAGPLDLLTARPSPALHASGLGDHLVEPGAVQRRALPAHPRPGRARAGGPAAPRSAARGCPTRRCPGRSRSGRAEPRPRRPGRGPGWRASARAGARPGGR